MSAQNVVNFHIFVLNPKNREKSLSQARKRSKN
jgi:hypothetical protein